MIVVLPGQNATLNWTFVGDPSRTTLVWYFTRRDGSKKEEIAFKFRTSAPGISNSSLPGVVIENPGTLVLKNVDARYNGKYQLVVLVSSRIGESSVEFFVAGKFFYENFRFNLSSEIKKGFGMFAVS